MTIQSLRCGALCIAAYLYLSSFVCVATAQVEASSAQTQLNGKVDLARLVDLTARRLGLNVEYDDTALRGTVTLRIGDSLTDEELWALTNRVLAARGMALVRILDGSDTTSSPGLLSVVKLSEALSLAGLEVDTESATSAGFSSLVVRVEHQSVKSIIEAIKPLLSRQSGAVTDLGADDLIMISDLSARITNALKLIKMLDVPRTRPVVETIEAQYLEATQLAALVTAAVQTRDGLSARPLPGKVSPTPSEGALILIAPPDAVEEWKAMIGRFDQREAAEMRTYSPTHFSADEVSRLIEETARDNGPRGSGEQWKLITDDLTGTLIVTATPHEHAQIEALLQRLAEAPPEARRPLRTFVIRNRSVLEVLDVLNQLMDAGALNSEVFAKKTKTDSSPMAQRAQRDIQDSVPPATAQTSIQDNESVSVNRTSARGSDTRSLMLTADEGTNTLIAIGEARLLSQLKTLIDQLDVRQTQVMIEAMVVSLTEGDTFDLGVEIEKLEVSGNTLISLSSLFGLGGAGLVSGSALPGASGSGFSGVALNPGDFSIVLRALATINEGRSMSMPKILVNNNQQATLDSVLQQPFLSTNASSTVATTSFGGTEDAGTTVSVTPHIAEGDHLVLEYTVSLSTFVGESSDPALPPPRQQNSLSSVVTIPDGYTIVVGGLEVTSEAEAVSKIPLLGDLPGIGELFKNRSKSQSRSRFYLFIRSSVMRHEGFEDLKYISDQDAFAAGIDDGWPEVRPRIIR